MKIFWPYRSDPKGFSIEDLARQYRDKISGTKVSSNKTSNPYSNDRNLKSLYEDSKHIDLLNPSLKRVHWANRDFSEYKEVA